MEQQQRDRLRLEPEDEVSKQAAKQQKNHTKPQHTLIRRLQLEIDQLQDQPAPDPANYSQPRHYRAALTRRANTVKQRQHKIKQAQQDLGITLPSADEN